MISIDGAQLDTGVFPGGEVLAHVPPTGSIVQVDARLGSPADAMSLLAVKEVLQRRGAVVHLFCPYVPGARADRAEPEDMVFGARFYAGLLNAANFASITVVDPHSDVVTALLDRVHVLTQAATVAQALADHDFAAVIAPDAGAAKKALATAEKLGIGTVLQARKHRDPATGRITTDGLEAHSLPTGAKVLVVDDICDGGGTFLGLADALTDLTPSLWTTHGIYSRGTHDLLQRYAELHCTDSFPTKADTTGVTVHKLEA